MAMPVGKVCDCFENRYTKETNIISNLIESSLDKYQPCVQNNCSCYLPTLERDLSIFKHGIDKELIKQSFGKGTRYQIINHKLYRQKECMFPTRCGGVEYFIKKHLKELPNMEMIINCRDWPQIHKGYTEPMPVFSFSKTNEYFDILMPAWSFFQGGPAISLYPVGLGRWDKHRISISNASKKLPWSKKLKKGFFRGSRTSKERDSLIYLSRNFSNLIDAQYTKNQAWRSDADTLGADPAQEISLEDHCQYKFLFNFHGVAASFRFKHLFLCKSLVFHVGDKWEEFFYSSLKPWVHYVPIKSDPTVEELKSIIEYFLVHDEEAREIAKRGYNFIWNNLKMDDIHCYWSKLLQEYSKLIKYDIELDKDLQEV